MPERGANRSSNPPPPRAPPARRSWWDNKNDDEDNATRDGETMEDARHLCRYLYDAPYPPLLPINQVLSAAGCEIKHPAGTTILDHLGEDERQEFRKYVQFIAEQRGEIQMASLARSVREGEPLFISLVKTSTEVLSLGPKFCYLCQLELETQFEVLLNQTYDSQSVSA
ncbi:unnamed protein product [Schistocephalus solidus]|uniref:DUF4187 domain-containing protein n=1 Tax=Schistocephalus solidus TaxID=70667 RepID=A0A183SMY4_SCHSO|nr:unnamed protein product [Schistocephalus solidus]